MTMEKLGMKKFLRLLQIESIRNHCVQQKINTIPPEANTVKQAFIQTIGNQSIEWFISAVIFNGLGDDGEALRIRIYIIFLEAINESAGVVENLKTVVVVARKL